MDNKDLKKLTSEAYPKSVPKEGEEKKKDDDSDYDWDFEDDQE
jgi:hypothetical protein